MPAMSHTFVRACPSASVLAPLFSLVRHVLTYSTDLLLRCLPGAASLPTPCLPAADASLAAPLSISEADWLLYRQKSGRVVFGMTGRLRTFRQLSSFGRSRANAFGAKTRKI